MIGWVNQLYVKTISKRKHVRYCIFRPSLMKPLVWKSWWSRGVRISTSTNMSCARQDGDKISSGNTLRLQMMCQIADSFLTGGIHLGAVVGAGVALEAGDGVPQQQQEPQQHGSPECRRCVTVTLWQWHTLADIGLPHVPDFLESSTCPPPHRRVQGQVCVCTMHSIDSLTT